MNPNYQQENLALLEAMHFLSSPLICNPCATLRSIPNALQLGIQINLILTSSPYTIRTSAMKRVEKTWTQTSIVGRLYGDTQRKFLISSGTGALVR